MTLGGTQNTSNVNMSKNVFEVKTYSIQAFRSLKIGKIYKMFDQWDMRQGFATHEKTHGHEGVYCTYFYF